VFDISSMYVYVPNIIIDPLVANGTLTTRYSGNKFPFYTIPCNTTINFRISFNFAKQVITLDSSDILTRLYTLPGVCDLKLQPYRAYASGIVGSYNSSPKFVLGSVFTHKNCLCYHYAMNTLGIGVPKKKKTLFV
jgi:hypothetical protein